MRILDIVSSLDPARGGVAEGLRQAVLATRALGHREEVLTLDAPQAPWLRDFPAATHALGPGWGGYRYTRRIGPWLEAHAASFDALVVHGLWQHHGVAVRSALRGSRVPYYLFVHGMLDPWFKRRHPLKHLKKRLYWPWADYRVARDAKAVLFTSEDEMRLASESFRRYRATPVVVGYGLALHADATASPAEAFFDAHPATRGQRNLLFLGRLHPKKGCDLLIDAFARVASRDPRLHLVMAGPDPIGWQRVLQRQAVGLGIAHRVSWPGMLAGTMKWSALRAAEAFVLPSHQENFGMAVAEALALGVPVLVSTRVNTWREIVEAGAGLADEDTLAGTSSLLERWLRLDADQRSSMACDAHRCFESHFRAEAFATRFIATLEQGRA